MKDKNPQEGIRRRFVVALVFELFMLAAVASASDPVIRILGFVITVIFASLYLLGLSDRSSIVP